MKRLKTLLLLMAVILSFTACTGASKEKAGSTDSSSTEEDEDDWDDEIEFEEIDQDMADGVLERQLSGIGCHAIFSEYTEVDDEYCYLYSVVNKDDEELDQMLAVNAISGEVMVYDGENDKLLPYERFEYYVDDGKSPAVWDGEYYLAPRTVRLEPADDSSFEFSIIRDDEKEPELEGIARTGKNSNREAVCEEEDISLTFVYKGDTLEIRDNGNISGVAGIYERKK